MLPTEDSAPTGAAETATNQLDDLLDSSIGKQNSEKDNQFAKIGEVVERDDETGVMEIESLCMNCHDNVSCNAFAYNLNRTN
jgi:hypothetical protein